MSTSVEVNFNKANDTSITGTSTTISTDMYCKYRLLCGYCELRKCQCTIVFSTSGSLYQSLPIINYCKDGIPQ